jgi:putative hydrolase of the HAD superfamily
MAKSVNPAAIEAIFLDVGNTLRILVKEEPYRAAARLKIVAMLGISDDPLKYVTELDRRYKAYRVWAFEQLTEASEAELWSRWLAPEIPAERTTPIAAELTYQFRQAMGKRVNAEDGKQVVIELFNRGYVMGIISNVITSGEIPEWLASDGLDKYFKAVVLSSLFGRRKPHPSIYMEAARRANIAPEKCVYVGDNFSRDVEGTRAAGFGMVIIMPDPTEKDDPVPMQYQPDLVIHSLSDLLNIFPARSNHKEETTKP